MLCAENVFSKTALICSVRAQIGFTVRTAFFVMIAVRTYTFMGFIKGGVVTIYSSLGVFLNENDHEMS